jgi:hypothetical protein
MHVVALMMRCFPPGFIFIWLAIKAVQYYNAKTQVIKNTYT